MVDSLKGVFVGQIAVVALGVLVIGSEYSTGMIRTTFAPSRGAGGCWSPRRSTSARSRSRPAWPPPSLSYPAGGALLSGNGYPSLTVADGLVPVTVTALYLTALALFSLGVGAMLRGTTGAVTFVLSLLLLPLIAAPLLGERTGVTAAERRPDERRLALLRNVDRVEERRRPASGGPRRGVAVGRGPRWRSPCG